MAFEVTNAEITLGELQKDVLMLFEKDISVTWVSLVWESVTYAKPDSQPFVEASEGDVLNAVLKRASRSMRWKSIFARVLIK